jgi:hypothetical protein
VAAPKKLDAMSMISTAMGKPKPKPANCKPDGKAAKRMRLHDALLLPLGRL